MTHARRSYGGLCKDDFIEKDIFSPAIGPYGRKWSFLTIWYLPGSCEVEAHAMGHVLSHGRVCPNHDGGLCDRFGTNWSNLK